MTKAQQAALAAKIEMLTLRQRIARFVLFVGLAVSTGANVMQSARLGWVGWVIAGLAPVALFGCLLLLELIGRDIPIAKLVLIYVVLAAIALIAGYVSYLHIYRLSYGTTHDVVISAMTPFMIDIPMIIASVLLSETRKALTLTQVPAAPVKRSAATTQVAPVPVATTPRKRSNASVKPLAATA